MDADEKIYAGLDLNAQATLFRVKDGEPIAIQNAEWCVMLKQMSAAPGEMVRAYLHREGAQNPYFDNFDVPDDVPDEEPNPDGSVRVDQFHLFCAILTHLNKCHPGMTYHAKHINAVKDAADLIVAQLAKPGD